MAIPTRPMLNYYGGKWNAASWITSHFPKHEIYVEAFGGAASVLITKVPVALEILNDLDDEIVNLYRVLRDEGAELKRLCELTPFSRIEYSKAREGTSNPIEQARRTIIKSYFGIGDSISNKTGFRTSRKSNTSASGSWRTYTLAMGALVNRLKYVTIEHSDYKTLLRKYDSEETLFYLDPPYVHSMRSSKDSYKHEFSNQDHADLLEYIQGLKGYVILSGYDSEAYSNLPWRKVFLESRTQSGVAIEVLWLCPRTEKHQQQIHFNL